VAPGRRAHFKAPLRKLFFHRQWAAPKEVDCPEIHCQEVGRREVGCRRVAEVVQVPPGAAVAAVLSSAGVLAGAAAVAGRSVAGRHADTDSSR